jgi:Flp pilus assembly protein TadB
MPENPSHDENDEFELEPVDPDILARQRERTKRQSRAAEDAIDVNAVFDQENLGDPVDLEQLKKFRFTTRHLLIVTALLALVMTISMRLGGCMGLFVSGCLALGAGWWFVWREEQRRLEKQAASREKLDERIARQRASEDGKPLPTGKAQGFEQASSEKSASSEEENGALSTWKFSFSMQEQFVTFTIAAVTLGCTQVLGFDNAGLLLGFVALVGLVVQALGVELPPLVVLGWWLLLVLYILVSFWVVWIAPAAG